MLSSEDFFKDKSDNFSTGGSSRSGLNSSTEKAELIEKVYKRVLGRKPTSREMSFYKYGVLSEEELISKLISSDEHKRVLKDAKRVSNLEERQRDLEIDVKKLNQKIKDISEENIHQLELLSEKNRIIEELRDELANPYNLVSNVEKYEEGFDVYRSGYKKEEKVKKESLFEKIKDILDNILN